MSEQSGKLVGLARDARRENRLQDAHQYLREAVALSRAAGDTVDLANALTALGQNERDLGHNDVALQHYEEAAEIYRPSADIQRLAHTIRHLGDLYRHERVNEKAEACYREALDLYRADVKTTPLDLANAIRGFAMLQHDAGQNKEAKQLWTEARELYGAVNVEAGVKESTRRLGLLANSL
ncbi:MAG TPA: tetratricopeptide repeat protein [Candidatus Sulfotelmatobacter sp.]